VRVLTLYGTVAGFAWINLDTEKVHIVIYDQSAVIHNVWAWTDLGEWVYEALLTQGETDAWLGAIALVERIKANTIQAVTKRRHDAAVAWRYYLMPKVRKAMVFWIRS
jgi:hypothetical protein